MPSFTNNSADLPASLTQEEAELYQMYSKHLALPCPPPTDPRSPCSPLVTIEEELDLFTVYDTSLVHTSSSPSPPPTCVSALDSTKDSQPDPFALYQRAVTALCPSALSSADDSDGCAFVRSSQSQALLFHASAPTCQPSPGRAERQPSTLRRTARPTLTLRTSFLAGKEDSEDEAFETWQLAASLISPSPFTILPPSRPPPPPPRPPPSSSCLPSCFTSPSTLFPTSSPHSIALTSSPTQSPRSIDNNGPATSDQSSGCRVLALQGRLYEAMRLHVLRSADAFQAGQKVEIDSEQVRELERELEEEMGKWRDERLRRYVD